MPVARAGEGGGCSGNPQNPEYATVGGRTTCGYINSAVACRVCDCLVCVMCASI